MTADNRKKPGVAFRATVVVVVRVTEKDDFSVRMSPAAP
jgi:hypothetical protein